MSDDPILWRWQGFFGPMTIAAAAKQVADELPGDVAGAKIPPPGAPPVPVDPEGTVGMYALHVRPWAPVELPEGMKEANEALVGHLVGG